MQNKAFGFGRWRKSKIFTRIAQLHLKNESVLDAYFLLVINARLDGLHYINLT